MDGWLDWVTAGHKPGTHQLGLAALAGSLQVTKLVKCIWVLGMDGWLDWVTDSLHVTNLVRSIWCWVWKAALAGSLQVTKLVHWN